MRLNLLCCFKSPTSDDRNNSSTRTRASNSSHRPPLSRAPMTLVPAPAIPTIDIEARRQYAQSQLRGLSPPQKPRSAPASLSTSPALSRVLYIDPREISENPYMSSQQGIAASHTYLSIKENSYASIGPNTIDPNTYGNIYEPIDDSSLDLPPPYEPPHTSEPSLDYVSACSRTPSPIYYLQPRITAAQFLEVPDNYGPGTGQFGEPGISIG